LTFISLSRVLGQKHHTDSIFAGCGKVDTQVSALFLEEPMRHLEKDTGSVPCLGVGTTSASVAQINKDLNPLLDNVVGCRTLNVRYDTHATGVVFMLRIIEALFFEIR
jgi:hypothetical protein